MAYDIGLATGLNNTEIAEAIVDASNLNLHAVARSLNVPDNAVIYRLAGQVITAEAQYIYNPVDQSTWGRPSGVVDGEVIFSVIGSELKTGVAGVNTYTLITQEKSDLKMTYLEAVASTDIKLEDSIRITDRADGIFDVVLASSVIINIYSNIQCVGVASLALSLRHGAEVDMIALGFVDGDSSPATRTLNNSIINAIIPDTSIKALTTDKLAYYFHKGIIMPTVTTGFFGAKGNSPTRFYFDQVTVRNIPTARISTLEVSAELRPEGEPNEDNTALSYGTKTVQAGRAEFERIRLINDSAGDTFTNKLSRVGTGFFINSGWSSYDRIITEGWHVGSYEISFVTSRNQCEHIAFNIGFVYPAGTSSDLGAMFANGTNNDGATFTTTYTAGEEDEFQGFGYLFGALYYSVQSALAVDKIQRGYGVFANSAAYRTSYEFIGCGAEFVENDFVINAPNATVKIDGGQDWGLPIITNANRVHVTNRRFPAQMDDDLSAGVLIQDEQTFELANPVELAGQEASIPVNKGYNGLSYTRVKVDASAKYWRIHGRLEVNEFQMRKNIPVNGALTGTLKFYGLDMTDLTEFNGAMGVVQVNTIRFASTNLRQAIIDASLSGVTAVDDVDHWVVTKAALANAEHKFVVEVDLELKTGFSADFARVSTRPDEILIKGIDY